MYFPTWKNAVSLIGGYFATLIMETFANKKLYFSYCSQLKNVSRFTEE